VAGHVAGRARCDFSIPSLLSRGGAGAGGSLLPSVGPSSTGTDSDATTESSEERCQSTSSSLDEPCAAGVVTSQRHRDVTMTSYGRAPAQLTSQHQRRRQPDTRQQFECPQCNKVPDSLCI